MTQDQIDALLVGVEMPEPIGYVSEHTSTGPWHWQFNRTSAEVYKDTAVKIDAVVTLDQLRSTVAAAVAKKDAEIERLKVQNNVVAKACREAEEELGEWWEERDALKAKAAQLREALDECVKSLTVDASGKRVYPEARLKALAMIEVLEATK